MNVLSKKAKVYKIRPNKVVNIDFNSLEQRALLTKRLNAVNAWMHRSLESNCLWGVAVSRQIYTHLHEKYMQPHENKQRNKKL